MNDDIINYIFINNMTKLTDTIKKLVDETDVKVEVLHSITNLTENERNNNLDYISLMNENIEN